MDTTNMDTTNNMLNYSKYCQYRLPCGICQRTNTICPLAMPEEPMMVSVYAAPVRPYPWNYGETTTTATAYINRADGEGKEDAEVL